MKKILCLLLVLVMVLGLAGCQEAVEVLQDAAEIVSEFDSFSSTSTPPEDTEQTSATTTASSETTEPTTEVPNTSEVPETTEAPETSEEAPALDEHGSYTSVEDVSLYLHLYGKLPENFITKSKARNLGWPGGSLEPYAPGKCIGGDRFGNYEGLLPTDREYFECDIDTLGASSRGAKRIVFSEDGLIYYTDDHYESFTLLYGEE